MNLLILGRFSEPEKSKLAAHFSVTHEMLEPKNPSEIKPDLLQSLAKADVLIVRSRTKINADFLKLAKSLKMVITATAGFDHLDLKELQRRNILACHTPSSHTQSASELTFALILSLLRKISQNQAALRQGHWEREPLVGNELNEKTLGILGFGRIGKRIAKMAQAFGANVIAFDPFVDDFRSFNVQSVSFENLLSMSDILTIHTPLTAKTIGLFNSKTLSQMRNDAILINASRGKIVNEEDLLHAIQKKQIAGAGLDVFSEEPLPVNSKLIDHPQVLLTAHVGALTVEAFKRASLEAAEKAICFKNQEPISDLLPPKAAWYLES